MAKISKEDKELGLGPLFEVISVQRLGKYFSTQEIGQIRQKLRQIARGDNFSPNHLRIGGSFYWADTQEGYEFWQCIAHLLGEVYIYYPGNTNPSGYVKSILKGE